MKKLDDVIQKFWDLTDKELKSVYPVLQFVYDSRVKKKNHRAGDLEQSKEHLDFKNTSIHVLLDQLYQDTGDAGLEKFTARMVDIVADYIKQSLTKNIPTFEDIIRTLGDSNFFLLCGETQLTHKKNKEIGIKIRGCQFKQNKIFCNFSYNFLNSILGILFKDKMVITKEVSVGEERELCMFRFEIKPFKHIKVLHLR
jgi:hypothetical protein